VTGTRVAIVFSLAAGIAGAAQALISGALGRRVGTVGAAGFGVVLAAVIVVALAVALGRGGLIVAATHQPFWLWLGGLGSLGSPRIPVTITRATGLMLVGAGAALTLKR
jgi:uncharacterized membrane protein YdcZ (DUF606 family)